jgi:vesicle-fusing ATPase
VRDNVINQLLAKIDGVESLNNILIIGMTNRLDLIDEAILRPGRLEIHQEIGLPDEKGRKQIFEIHTRVPKVNGLLDDDVDLDYLASKTKNYTGAEIMGLCRTAISYTLYKDFAGGKIGKIDLE